MTDKTLQETETLVEESVSENGAEAPTAPTAEPETSTPDSATDETPEAPPSEEKTPSETTKKPKKSRKPKSKHIPLEVGQKVDGVVKTITDFGAFVGINNLSQDGLLHISELDRGRIEKVEDVVSVGDNVSVWVKNLDRDRGRIGLTLIKPPERTYHEINVGEEYEGDVKRIENYGAFVDIGLEREGFIHISELAHDYVKTPHDVVSMDDTVRVKVLEVNPRKKQVNLSIKALQEPPPSAQSESVEAYEDNSEPMQTAMAVAFSQTRDELQEEEEKAGSSASQQEKASLDELIRRSLET